MNLLLPCVYAFVACFADCFIVNIRGQMLFWAPLGASIGWLVYLLCGFFAQDLLCYFLATVVVSAYAELMARIKRVPATGFLLIGIFPMVPGGGIYYTMKYCIDGDTALFLETGIHTFGIAGCLALGVLVVTSILHLAHTIRHMRQA